MDWSSRNISVRLKDSSSLAMETNIENHGNCLSYGSTDEERNTAEITAFHNEDIGAATLSEELRDKLHLATANVSLATTNLLNGCIKSLCDDVKNVDLTMNGLNKCCKPVVNTCSDNPFSYERLSAENSQNTNGSRTECSNADASFVSEVYCSSNSVKATALSILNADVCSKIESSAEKNNLQCSSSCTNTVDGNEIGDVNITYLGYDSELQMPDIMRLIQKDLSEPYSIYTYRYFIHNWPKLCFLAQHDQKCVGAIVCKLDLHKKQNRRGYIAMLAVDEKYRKRKIGSNLVLKAIKAMVQDNADEVVLETEITNKPALRLYENLGFVRDKRLFRYYLNGVDALRLKLWLR